MNRMSPIATIVSSTLMLLFTVHIQAQETKQPADAQATEQVQVLSARVVNELTSSITNETWTPADPKNKGIALSVRLARGFDYSAKDFSLAFTVSNKNQKVLAVGHTAIPPAGWLFDKQGAEWSFFPGKMEGKPTIEMGLLFVLPLEVKEASLMYQDKVVGKPVTLKQD
jgi:hypothetical protein